MGKDAHISAIPNWTDDSDASIVADSQDTGYPVWGDYDASQRDLIIQDHTGTVVLHQGISAGVPTDLLETLLGLIDEISDDCVCPEIYNPVCGADGETYSNSCYADCEGVDYYIDGEMNNDNPCNPMECYQGEWLEIVIDCAEQMGFPCDGGVYVSPPDDVCCSTCVQYGDSNEDGVLNVLDIVVLVDSILNSNGSEFPQADMDQDGQINVVDVVILVNVVLNP